MVIIWIILGALLLWEIQSVWYAKHWDEELFVSLAFSRKSTVRGESCELLETIENRKLLPLPVLKVKFQVSRQLAFEDAGTESSVTDHITGTMFFRCVPIPDTSEVCGLPVKREDFTGSTAWTLWREICF